jgi:Cd2+/Zn2+-exporting ATPase
MAADARDIQILDATETESIPGLGARANLDGETVLVGSVRLFAASHPGIDRRIDDAVEAGQTAVVIGTAERIDGVIALADTIRPQTSAAVAELERLGVTPVMLSGDNQRTANRIGETAGIVDVRAGLLPNEKVDAVLDLERSFPVAMVGDGINDAPALAGASVGIAMGVAGTDVALEAADVALMRDDLTEVPAAIRLARRTMATIRQNIAASLLVKAGFLLLTFAGITNLWLAVLADTGMSLLVTLNALLLLRMGRHGH